MMADSEASERREVKEREREMRRAGQQLLRSEGRKTA